MIGERKLLARLDQMLEDGINGTFAESDYDESRLSRLEFRWFQYLTASKLSRQNVEREREKLKELVSDISHQTKTPLANILLYTQLLEEQELDAQSRQLAEEIRAQAEKTAGSVTPFSIASGNMARSRKKTSATSRSAILSSGSRRRAERRPMISGRSRRSSWPGLAGSKA